MFDSDRIMRISGASPFLSQRIEKGKNGIVYTKNANYSIKKHFLKKSDSKQFYDFFNHK